MFQNVQYVLMWQPKRKRSMELLGFFTLDHPREAQIDFGDVVFYEKGQKVEGKNQLFLPTATAAIRSCKRRKPGVPVYRDDSNIRAHEKVPAVIWFDNSPP